MFRKVLLSFAMVAFSGSVLAAPTANIYVKGKIGAPTCTINGQDTADIIYNFDVDLRNLEGQSVNGDYYQIGEQTQNMEVLCDAQTVLKFNVIDTKAGTFVNESPYAFGLGDYEQENIGVYFIKALNSSIKQTLESDEQYVHIDGGVVSGNEIGGQLMHGETYTWTNSDGTYATAQAFYTEIYVRALINPVIKNVAEEVELDGLAILSFSFGI